jgi:Ca2+-binding EF-hand superfamily protein
MMRKFRDVALFVVGILSFFTAATVLDVRAAQKVAVPKPSNTAVLAEDEVKQILLLMDTDKNGKISKKEFMDFMSAEFDRLDKDKSGELDQKELAQSQIRPGRSAVGK